MELVYTEAKTSVDQRHILTLGTSLAQWEGGGSSMKPGTDPSKSCRFCIVDRIGNGEVSLFSCSLVPPKKKYMWLPDLVNIINFPSNK